MTENSIFDLPRQEVFDILGNDVGLWTMRAKALFSSAKAVENRCGRVPKEPKGLSETLEWAEMHGVFRMLQGMAFECVLKTLWLKHGGLLVDKGKYRGIPGAKDHDLCELESKVAERVNTGLNSTEKMLLARLSFFITYGRYPVRKSVSGKHPSVPDDSKRALWCRWIPEDNKTLKVAKNKLFRLLEQ
jgi:hypothetical protein